MANRTGPMICPVDHAQLIMTERQGIEIDYCPTCRGVWLDRGELDKIIERSTAPGGGVGSVPGAQPGYGAPPAQPGYGAPPAQPGYGAHPPHGGHWQPSHVARPVHYGDDYKKHGYGYKKHWLHEIFD
jgi:uncharacterized protein